MALDLDAAQLLSLHGITREVAQVCLRNLKGQLQTMAPLFRPRRFLADHVEGTGKEAVANADRNFAEFRELFARVATKPFDLRPELRSPLESIPTQFQFDEWEYTHATETDRGWQSVRVATPLTWVLSYGSAYSLTTLRDAVSGNGQRNDEAIRAYVIRACLMHELLAKFPGIAELFAGLRYKLEVRRSPQLGDLPLVMVSAPFKTIRPPDKLVALASGLAGGTAFAEVLDLASVRNLADPLRDETLQILARHKVEI